MVQEIVRAECSILFDYDAFDPCHIPVTIGQGLHYEVANQASGTGTSVADDDQADALDAVQPIHDQLKIKPVWWLLEIIFTSYTYQNQQSKWVTKWR